MKFKQGTRRKAIEYEKDLVRYWKENGTFEKSVENRPKDNAYVFYDGPPFITGEPHHGTLLSSIVKDAVPRYWTMKGKRVERVWGWDCHGLPAEVFTEKKLGIQDRRDIGTKVSLEEYIRTCRENMVTTGNLWEDTIERVGRWVDFKGAYKTMDKDYMESIWWAFKQLYDKGKIYEGEKVLLYCTRDATPLSKAEVAMDNSYQDVTDPSVYVKFKIKDEDSFLLAWTTTPWTLPSNSAIAINKNIEYAEVELKGQKFILAKALLEKVLTDEKHQLLEYKTLRSLTGSELVGKSYEPLFDTHKDLGENAFKIWHADFVHDEDGTGIAHESPAYGEEDYQLSRQYDIPWVINTDENGYYTSGPWNGQNIWEVNKQIAKEMHSITPLDAVQGSKEERESRTDSTVNERQTQTDAAMRQKPQQVGSSAVGQTEAWRGAVWKIDYIKHSYPHCHRCGTKLMYRAHPSWFMDIDSQRADMLQNNQDINWFPEHIKNGRFAKTVESAPDWNLSRDRFWATAMPVWKGTDSEGNVRVKVVGSYAELKELSGIELNDYHRPWIDEVTFEIDGITYNRIDKVMDSWFEAGSMPFAQFHYPFENVEKFESSFPGDFIAEYVGQVRAWFYYLHALSNALFDKNSFKNVVVTGTVAGNDGRKMSKSYGNYTDPNDLMDQYSADSLRFLLLGSPLLNGEDFSLLDKDVGDVARKLSMVWNMYDFFTMYADVDGWEWKGSLDDPSNELTNILDTWIISRLHQLIEHVDKHMQVNNIPDAVADILPFIDDASNWYVRRSRKRFWKSEDDGDKNDAYRTLHYLLVKLAQVMAPFTPFLSEELYHKLTGGESVHLLDWPHPGKIDEQLVQDMASVRTSITEGLAKRAQAGIKVRQPLSLVTVPQVPDIYKEIIEEELNVKSVNWGDGVELDFDITPELKREGLMREVVRQIQSARKAAGLQVDDRITLVLETHDSELSQAISEHVDTIKHETLATELNSNGEAPHGAAVTIEGQELTIKLEKAS